MSIGMHNLKAEQVAHVLGGATRKGNGYLARCPAHNDLTASLAIDDKEGGGLLVKCFAGCDQPSVTDALKSRGLWPDQPPRTEYENVRQKVTGRYDYTDTAGNVLYSKVRLEPGKNGRKKDYQFRNAAKAKHPIYGYRNHPAVPYRLHEIVAAGSVMIHEGEKQADITAAMGLPSTSLDSGVESKITPEIVEVFMGKSIVIIRDNDEPGLKYAGKLAAALYGVARVIRVILLPGLPPKGDVEEWYAVPGNDRDKLLGIVNAAPEWVPGEQVPDLYTWPPPIDMLRLSRMNPVSPSFVMEPWLPCGYATLFSGHGGVGKSGIALGLFVCVSMGIPFFGVPVEQRRVLYLSCEDREGVLHWRLAKICAYLGIHLSELNGRLDIIDLVGHDTILYQPKREGSPLTAAYHQLAARMKTEQTQVLVVDGISDTYDGNENARAEVKAYVNALLALIPPDDGAVVLVGHVAKLAANTSTKEGYSGSTGWHNSVRARWYLYPELQNGDDGKPASTGNLMLELQKSNLGPADRAMKFAWDEAAGMFAGKIVGEESHFDKKYQERVEREALLAIFESRSVDIPSAAMGPRTAFHVLSVQPDFPASLLSGTPGKKRFWRLIEELRQMGLIEESSIRRSGRKTTAVLVPTNKAVSGCANAPNAENKDSAQYDAGATAPMRRILAGGLRGVYPAQHNIFHPATEDEFDDIEVAA